ncbi:MAG: hypothetical protein PHR92_15695 [Lachnospiraceae bacterium]|nr:hypothetical protein [Lachnospiraceae bacterium]
MLEIIDMHCHILPGLDDGSETEEMSLAMIAQAYKRGVRGLIATPHASPLFQSTSTETIRRMCRVLGQKASGMLNTEFPIYPGQEIFATSENLELLEQGKLLTLADSRYVLLELQPSAAFMDLFRVMRTVRNFGCIPVLAHVERYRVLYHNMEHLEELEYAGTLFQMNSHSLEGGLLDEKAHWCRELIKKQKIQFISSDMHNLQDRGPIGERAVNWITQKLPAGYGRALLAGNARDLLNIEAK